MTNTTTDELRARYDANGVVRAPILTGEEVSRHRAALESAEAELGPLHYIDKVHTVLTSPHRLATDPRVLDVVEALIGPDILVYNVTYIIKEPGSDTFVSWHQDLTYWGLADDDAQVSMWLALAPATEASGAMSMIPGSHRAGRMDHVEDASEDNVLLMGQRIEVVDAERAELCSLEPGQASFHHGWTVHASGPNTSTDRRIGLNVQYLAPHNQQQEAGATAMLVRGQDRHDHFGTDTPPTVDLDPAAITRWRELDAAMKRRFQTK